MYKPSAGVDNLPDMVDNLPELVVNVLFGEMLPAVALPTVIPPQDSRRSAAVITAPDATPEPPELPACRPCRACVDRRPPLHYTLL